VVDPGSTKLALVLSDRGLETVPGDAWRHRRLRMLDLGHNRLSTLPDEIGELAELETLYLHDNQLGELPAALFELRGLRFLNAGGNGSRCFRPRSSA
jgi:Leucine-rich repeat (LRR) protein